jgi:zinc transporter 1/2/3
MEKATILKLIFIFLAFFEAFLMGIIPVKSKTFKDSPKILGIANAFAGGVFISIALLHILPEQSEAELDDEFKTKHGDYPLAFLFTVVGYTIILILDKILIDAHDHESHD